MKKIPKPITSAPITPTMGAHMITESISSELEVVVLVVRVGTGAFSSILLHFPESLIVQKPIHSQVA